GVRLIEIFPLALHIGAELSPHVRALVVLQAHLLQGLVDHVLGAFHQPLPVGVLNAQDELPALGLGHQVLVQGRAQVAHVHKARGAGGESRSHSCHCRRSLFMVYWPQKAREKGSLYYSKKSLFGNKNFRATPVPRWTFATFGGISRENHLSLRRRGKAYK